MNWLMMPRCVVNPEIPWRLIIAWRNRLVHAYPGIDDDTLWSVIRDAIPDLLLAHKHFSGIPYPSVPSRELRRPAGQGQEP